MFYTYILYSTSIDKFYIGASEDPQERLKKHNAKNKGFTNQANNWNICFLKEFGTKEEALAFERKIKAWKSKILIRKLIESTGSELQQTSPTGLKHPGMEETTSPINHPH